MVILRKCYQCSSSIFKVCSKTIIPINYSTTANNMLDIKTFVFLDTESTGLPFLENFKTRITEMCMVAVEAEHIRLGVFPRVQNKLSFCFNPWRLISAEAEKITALSNMLLEHQSGFSKNTVEIINNFLNHNRQPVCLVAHNGDNFDFPLIQKEIRNAKSSLLENVYCLDSLKAFRALHITTHTREECVVTLENGTLKENAADADKILNENADIHDDLSIQSNDHSQSPIRKKVLLSQKENETTPLKPIINSHAASRSPKKIKLAKRELHSELSFKLADVYRRLTKKEPIEAHQAEADVLTLITCAATLGDDFVDWANENAKKFCDIPPLQPTWNMAHRKL